MKHHYNVRPRSGRETLTENSRDRERERAAFNMLTCIYGDITVNTFTHTLTLIRCNLLLKHWPTCVTTSLPAGRTRPLSRVSQSQHRKQTAVFLHLIIHLILQQQRLNTYTQNLLQNAIYYISTQTHKRKKHIPTFRRKKTNTETIRKERQHRGSEANNQWIVYFWIIIIF